MKETLPVEFLVLRKILGEDECWLSPDRALDRHGYGAVTVRRGDESSTLRAHRAIYEWVHGPIPAGMDLDHLCRNPACCNPRHLEVVTRSENLLRGFESRGGRVYCKYGHLLEGENLRLVRRDGRGVQRVCRECNRIYCRNYNARRKLEVQ